MITSHCFIGNLGILKAMKFSLDWPGDSTGGKKIPGTFSVSSRDGTIDKFKEPWVPKFSQHNVFEDAQ